MVLRDVFDIEADLKPVWIGIRKVIELTADKFEHDLPNSNDPADFDRGFLDLIASHPRASGIIYNSVKHLLAFKSLAYHRRLVDLFSDLRESDLVGSSSVSNGIRMDIPNSTKRMVPWHQDFLFQLRSADGIVFWIPLVPITKESGPVVLLPASHLEGPYPLEETPESDAAVANGLYESIRMEGEENVMKRYSSIAPESKPGDVLVFDFMTVHKSGYNHSDRTRWSAQIRYFNFRDPYGRSIEWTGSFKTNRTIREINKQIMPLSRR